MDGPQQYAYLLGIPPLRDFLDFLKTRSPGEVSDAATRMREWRSASARFEELQRQEEGCADHPHLAQLPPPMEPLAGAHVQGAELSQALASLPSLWALVELEKLIVDQRSIDLTYTEQLCAALQPPHSQEQLFQFTAGQCPPLAEVSVSRVSDAVYAFSSVSADLRLLNVSFLNPAEYRNSSSSGFPTHVLAVAIGFGLNCLCALHIKDRLILINGTHRAYVLHQRGFVQVPCLIREVSSEDELDFIGATDLKSRLAVYLRARRPPLIKDFFDPRLRAVIQGPAGVRRLLHVQVQAQRSRFSIA